MTHSDETRELAGETRFSAEFWRSPFAVAAAVVLSAQTMMMLYGALTGRDMNFAMTMPMIMVAAMMLTAGVWPGWNFISLSREGLEQHAGLTGIKLAWSKVQNVRAFQSWVEIRYVDGKKIGERTVKTVRILNRYGIDPGEFGDLIDERWRTARGQEY